MLQSPAAPTSRNTNVNTKLGGSIKRDINLLPANENSEKIARQGTIILAVFVGLLLLSYFIIAMPLMALKSLQDKASFAENQLTQKKQADAEFARLAEQKTTLTQMIGSLDAAEKTFKHPADQYDLIAKACPDAVTLLSATMSADGMVIIGRAADDSDIAQFVVNLGTLPGYSSIVLNSVQELETEEKADQPRIFEVKANVAPAILPVETAKGGEGK